MQADIEQPQQVENNDRPGRHHFRRRVSLEENQLRLDQYLPRVFPKFSRVFWKKAITVGAVHLDGRRMSQCSRQVEAGQGIEVFIDGLPLEKFILEEKHIIFRDENLLILNKPAGIDTQPTPSRFQGTLYQGILDYLGRSKGHGRKADIGMVQRLDRDTSGAIIFSIHPRAHRSVSRQVQQHSVGKTYLALVCGDLDPAQGEFRSELAKNRATNLVRSVSHGGKPALTRYRTIYSSSNVSLVEVELVTGRMHQIRAHFSEAGHPLYGDSRYGGPVVAGGRPLDHQMLHSWKLFLAHPVTGDPLKLKAPLPSDWFELMESCGFPPQIMNDLAG